MQHFQSILIAIGILAIAGVLIHGFLANRKEQLALKELEKEQYDEQYFDDELQDVEISEPVIKGRRERDDVALSAEKEEVDNFHFNFNDSDPLETKDEEPVLPLRAKEKQFESHLEAEVIREIPVKDFQMADTIESIEKRNQAAPKAEPAEMGEVELFIFNVASRGDNRLGGHELLQFFLTSGFRYGEMNIFHRHEHSDGTGEVLFSIANMMAPGTFDLDTIEQFNSPGISFFFTAPNAKISVNKSFDMMLRAVEQVAEEFDCDVLNEKRELFTAEQFREYQERLKKYK